MNVLRLHGVNDLRLHTEAPPEPRAGELLLRVKAVGICASDLHWFCEGSIGDAALKRPLVLGHEFAGEVVEDPTGTLAAGTRVAVEPAVSCGACELCLLGHPNLCERLYFSGHGETDGALRELMAWPARNAYPIPDSLSDASGAALEPLGVAIHTVDLGHVKPGMAVGVYGCGPIGLLTLQVARLAGAVHIIATDRLPHRLAAAHSLGADTTIQADGGENEQILAATGGRGVDVAFEAAGENEAVETAVHTARLGGRVVLAGIPAEDRTTFTASVARRKGLTIAMVRRMKHTYPRAIRMVESGRIDLHSLVTHRFPLTEFKPAFDVAVRREGVKVILEP